MDAEFAARGVPAVSWRAAELCDEVCGGIAGAYGGWLREGFKAWMWPGLMTPGSSLLITLWHTSPWHMHDDHHAVLLQERPGCSPAEAMVQDI